MNREIEKIVARLREHFWGDPWYGKNAETLLAEVQEDAAFDKQQGGHSILELLWHMITWKEFVLTRLDAGEHVDLKYFEEQDWRVLDHNDKSLWPQGLERYRKLHEEMIVEIEKQDDSLLTQTAPGRTYNYKRLLEGIAEHDVYHLGQIAILNKICKAHN